MPNDRGDDLQDHHNEGQEDASEGDYDPPHTIIPVVDSLLYGEKTVEKMEEDNEAYNKGWSHGYKQK